MVNQNNFIKCDSFRYRTHFYNTNGKEVIFFPSRELEIAF